MRQDSSMFLENCFITEKRPEREKKLLHHRRKTNSFSKTEPLAVDDVFSLYQDLHFLVDRHFKLILPISVPQWEASINIRESFSLSSHSPQWNASTWLAMHLSNWIAQQSIKNQDEASRSGHGNAFSFKIYCDRYSLVIQGNHKALLPPCTHQYAATPALAQPPSLLSPSHTSVTIQVRYGYANHPSCS